jgi:hypothetical protein
MSNGIVSVAAQVKESSGGPRNATCSKPACPACGGQLIEIRAKLQCARCHTICETCCEGGRG